MTESMDEIHRRIDGTIDPETREAMRSGLSPDGYAIAKFVSQSDSLIQMALDTLSGGGPRTDAILYLNSAREYNAAVFAKLKEAKP